MCCLSTRAGLYKKLMFAVNVPVIEKLAIGIARNLPTNRSCWNREVWLEDMLLRYLLKLASTRDTLTVRRVVGRFDFALEVLDQRFFFD